MNYLILDNGGNAIGQNLPLDSHTLGKAYDGLIKVYKFDDGKYWKLQVMAEDKRWVAIIYRRIQGWCLKSQYLNHSHDST